MDLLQAFTDDSAAQAGDKRLYLAGYLHRADVWASFSKDWHKELKAWPAIEYLKASEAHHLSGQFHHSQWDEQMRDAKLAKLAAIIAHYQPVSYEFSVNGRLFEDELKPVSPYGFGRLHFTMCFTVLSGVARFTAESPVRAPVQFIFDEQQGVDADVEMFMAEMIKALPVEARKLVDGLPQFKNEKEQPYAPLQAADLLAWHLRREHETGEKLARTNSLISSDGHLVQEIPDEVLRSWATHHATLPGVPLLQSKRQWKGFKAEHKRLMDAGIDPSKITGSGIYYPEGSSVLVRTIDWFRRQLFGSRYLSL
ncbi:DUF3800 domain-containing protein [Bradyrhizobium sp. BR13661]|uniref:DUF3800 domain-containing protein n=1 Tax=Bradyrhizobium sp. BR13661 TaxID=2940622 RepID=UPI0024739C04|nr:DUF3800 domain-containing protein [Bradyrhizobium sp. BR13661]